MKIHLARKGRVWKWEIIQNRWVLAGGWCATKKAARNDAEAWLRLNP